MGPVSSAAVPGLRRLAVKHGFMGRDDDNTPQGVLARGTTKLICWTVGFALYCGLVDGFMILIGVKP